MSENILDRLNAGDERKVSDQFKAKLLELYQETADRILANVSDTVKSTLSIDDGKALLNELHSMDPDDIKGFEETIYAVDKVNNHKGIGSGLIYTAHPDAFLSIVEAVAANSETESDFYQKIGDTLDQGLIPGIDSKGNAMPSPTGHTATQSPVDSIAETMREALSDPEISESDLKHWQALAVQNWGEHYRDIKTADQVPITNEIYSRLKTDIDQKGIIDDGRVGIAKIFGYEPEGVQDEPNSPQANDLAVPNWGNQ